MLIEVRDIKQWVMDWFCSQLDLTRAEVEENYTENYLRIGWMDSLKIADFILQIEKKFNFRFTDQDFKNGQFHTLGGVIKIIESKNLTKEMTSQRTCIDYQEALDSAIPRALEEAGVRDGDLIFVHSDITLFTKALQGQNNNVKQTLISVLKRSVGLTGTLIFPMFNYDFCNGKIFDVQSTPSTVGVLTEYVRTLPEFKRTVHPIYSVGIYGKLQKELLDVSNDCFDQNSIFGKMYSHKGKFVFMGVSFQSCTFVHYCEQAFGVPHRHMKEFKGKIVNGSLTYEDVFTFYVRQLSPEVFYDLTNVEQYLIKNCFMTKVDSGYGPIMVIEARILYREMMKFLKNDVTSFLTKDPVW